MINKKELEAILNNPFNLQDWKLVLTEFFGTKNLRQQPVEILLPLNDKAKCAFELGSFNTIDDRIIGLYHVIVKSNVRLEKNKVGLRQLLRSIYKYDVDGALVVFEQGSNWRLSFVSEIRTFDGTGALVKNITEPKRYTYLLGEAAKTSTPVSRITLLEGKEISLEDIRNAFSVESLNEEFYKIIADQFYLLVGGNVDIGNKIKEFPRQLKLPSLDNNDINNYEIFQKFAVRLIGRIVFCWFLKVKKSDKGKPLLPEEMLNSKVVNNHPDYYHTVLERLFFQTLNTPVNYRVQSLPDGFEDIPFLNGGLFEPQKEDFYSINSITDLSENINTLKIPNEWFDKFFSRIEKYNFTIDENSSVDLEVSVDPEMLGRIFENLLAEIDPRSGESARKSTGSFYTPREIVDYMVSESLVRYLNNLTGIDATILCELLKLDSDVCLSDFEKERIIDAFDEIKILDPACGSGAFPLGIMQKMLIALQKIDTNAEKWKVRQISKIENVPFRNIVERKIRDSSVDYSIKLGIIQNNLHGVDIQPIATEISKLRCFLSLIVDENIDDDKPNRGIEALPNLEFKFVATDSLMSLPEDNFGGLFDINNDLAKLQQIRNDYLQSYGQEKLDIKTKFKSLQKEIIKFQMTNRFEVHNSRLSLLSEWDPFGNESTDWFNPELMFGVKFFDIIIGNPPFGTPIKNVYRNAVVSRLGKVPDFEIYYYFIEIARLHLKITGILSYIIPNSFLFNVNARAYRAELLEAWSLFEILDCTRFPIFKSAVVRNCIINWNRGKTQTIGYHHTKGVTNFADLIKKPKMQLEKKEITKFNHNWGLAFFLEPEVIRIIESIQSNSKPLSDYFPEISQGLIAYDKYRGQSDETIKVRKYHFDSKIREDLKPWLWGSDVNRYQVKWNGQEYIDYCDGIANPRDPKYFRGKRILIREITNPSIFAVLTEEELYNDPSIIIIRDNASHSLKSLLGILNSKLATFYHFNNSPKATKGAFPKILVKDIKEFPLPPTYSSISLENIVDYILWLYKFGESTRIMNYFANSHLVQFFEEILNAIVYEVYFEQEFAKNNIEIIKYIKKYFKSIDGLGDEEIKKEIYSVYQSLSERDNEIRQNIKSMDSRLSSIIRHIKNAGIYESY